MGRVVVGLVEAGNDVVVVEAGNDVVAVEVVAGDSVSVAGAVFEASSPPHEANTRRDAATAQPE